MTSKSREGGLIISQKNNKKQLFQEYLANFSGSRPDDQNPFKLFENCWSSKIPSIQNTGNLDVFKDARIDYFCQAFGDMKGRTILELGPLEAGHTYMLEEAGAKVTAVEGNYGAFLRCLTVKNLFNLRAKFVLGDFSKMEPCEVKYDAIVACGVLYHMADPVAFLKDLAERTDNIFIWTHYFDENFGKWSSMARKQLKNGKWDLDHIQSQEINGFEVRTVRQSYGGALGWAGFTGGTETFSYWIFKEDLIHLLKSLGFSNIRIGLHLDQVDHQHGPCFAIFASKSAQQEEIDVSYYLNPDVHPDLYEEFGHLPEYEKELKALEHFIGWGKKEGRLPKAPLVEETV
jgi:hypothetical protein